MRLPFSDSRSPGFSLVETLISAALVLLVFGLGGHFLIPLMRMQVKGGERAEMQQRAAIVIDELRRDLALSTTAGLSLWQSPTGLLMAIHPADNLAQDGTLVWRDQVVLYQWSQADGIWRRGLWSDPERRLLKAAAPTRLAEDNLRRAAAEMTPRRLTSGVRAVSLGPSLSLPLTVRLSFATPSGETRQVVNVLGGRLPAP